MQIGVIGLGRMGGNITRRLMRTITNRSFMTTMPKPLPH